MEYKTLVYVLNQISKQTRGTIKQQILKQYFKTLNLDVVKHIIYIIDEQIPIKKQFAVGIKTIEHISNISISEDLNTRNISTQWVQKIENYQKLYDILKKIKGKNSVSIKLNILAKCINCFQSDIEKQYFKRIVLNNLRVGLKNKLLLKTISEVFNLNLNDLKMQFNTNPSAFNALNRVLNNEKTLEPIPIKCMLVKNYKKSIFQKLKQHYVYELKYDGIRCQIHIVDEVIKIYTRNLTDITNSVVNHIFKHIGNLKGRYILDAELCGIDFQTLTKIIMRKYEQVETESQNFFTQLYIFDILYFEDKYIIDSPYLERKSILKKLLTKYSLDNYYVSYYDIKEEVIEGVKNGTMYNECEGIVLKDLKSIYKPNTRDNSWLKIKKNELQGDFIVLQAYKGTGAYSIYYSSLLLGCNSNKGIVSIGQIGSGLSQTTLNWIRDYIFEDSNSIEIYDRYTLKKPFVIEVIYQNIQRSKTYSSGFSLRFPRFIKFRFDKDIIDAETWSI